MFLLDAAGEILQTTILPLPAATGAADRKY
jgi:hypothetical protein